ncbi:MAG: PLP-dependent aminotransferase family protein [Chloroflexota bacterium]
MGLEHLLSQRTERMGANAIREILKVVSQPGMVSLAGGIPAADSFPMAVFGDITSAVLEQYGSRALQYDATEGFAPLQEALSLYLADHKQIACKPSDILIFSGSQGILDGVGKILITKGDIIALESPSYLGAISAFNPYEPQYVSVAMDEDGLIPDSLETVLEQNTIKFVYLVPTFQNPTGRSLALERRKQVADLIQKYNVLLLEDDPYGALRYSGDLLPPIQTFAPENVIYSSTFSKILAPGLRIGFCVAPEPIRHWLTVAKQGVDLHTNTFGQAIATEYLQGGYLSTQLPKIIELYRPRRDAMVAALQKYMPAGFSWTIPDGGMFFWVEGPSGFDAEALYWQCVEKKVAFVPGKFFYANETSIGQATLRLNFTMADEATIEMAVKTIGDVARHMMG